MRVEGDTLKPWCEREDGRDSSYKRRKGGGEQKGTRGRTLTRLSKRGSEGVERR